MNTKLPEHIVATQTDAIGKPLRAFHGSHMIPIIIAIAAFCLLIVASVCLRQTRQQS